MIDMAISQMEASSDQVDSWVKIDDVADAIRGSHRLPYSIIHDHLHF
jgi:hypothetical protein